MPILVKCKVTRKVWQNFSPNKALARYWVEDKAWQMSPVTRLGYWSLIGPEWSRDLDTGLSLADVTSNETLWRIQRTQKQVNPRRYIKERANQTMTKPNCNLFNIWEHSLVSWCSCSCLLPMRWQISCYLGQPEDRGCSVALHNSWLIYFALSFIHLLELTSAALLHPGLK